MCGLYRIELAGLMGLCVAWLMVLHQQVAWFGAAVWNETNSFQVLEPSLCATHPQRECWEFRHSEAQGIRKFTMVLGSFCSAGD